MSLIEFFSKYYISRDKVCGICPISVKNELIDTWLLEVINRDFPILDPASNSKMGFNPYFLPKGHEKLKRYFMSSRITNDIYLILEGKQAMMMIAPYEREEI